MAHRTPLTARVALIAGLVLAIGVARAFVVPSTAFGESDEVEPSPTWPPMVVADQEVRIRPEQGHGVAGRVVRVDDDQLTIRYRPRLFRRFRTPVEQAFDREGIRRIDLVDSTWNGAAIGAAGAIAFTAIGIHKDCTPSCNDNFGKGGRWVMGTLGFVLPATAVGALIDGALSRRIYEAGPARSVRVVPTLGRGRKGVVAALTF